jgi:hypothetical protein
VFTVAQHWEETGRPGPAGRSRAPFLAVIGEAGSDPVW